MALSLPAITNPIDPSQPDLTNTYWRIVDVYIGAGDGVANVVAYGYTSKAARDAGGQNIGQISQAITGDAYKQMYADHIAGKANLFQQAYAVLRLAPGAELDEEKKPVPFFAEAKDV